MNTTLKLGALSLALTLGALVGGSSEAQAGGGNGHGGGRQGSAGNHNFGPRQNFNHNFGHHQNFNHNFGPRHNFNHNFRPGFSHGHFGPFRPVVVFVPHGHHGHHCDYDCRFFVPPHGFRR